MHIDWNAWKEIRDLTLWANGYFVFWESEPGRRVVQSPYSASRSHGIIEGAILEEVILPRALGQVAPVDACVEELNERFLRLSKQ